MKQYLGQLDLITYHKKDKSALNMTHMNLSKAKFAVVSRYFFHREISFPENFC